MIDIWVAFAVGIINSGIFWIYIRRSIVVGCFLGELSASGLSPIVKPMNRLSQTKFQKHVYHKAEGSKIRAPILGQFHFLIPHLEIMNLIQTSKHSHQNVNFKHTQNIVLFVVPVWGSET